MSTRRASLARRSAAAALAAAALTSAGCSHRAPQRHDIHIKNFLFVPRRLAVRPGDTLHFVNDDMVPHTATAAGGAWDTGNLNAGESRDVVVPDPARSEYSCRYHPTMQGSLTGAGD